MPIDDNNINALFKRWYGRDATQGELDHWKAKEQNQLESALLNDVKVKRVIDAFQKYRGRKPSSEEMATYRTADPTQMMNDLVQSSENILGEGNEEQQTTIEETQPIETNIPTFEESEFYKSFQEDIPTLKTQAEQEFQTYYDDLLKDAQGDYNTAKSRLEADYQRAIGVNDLDAAQLLRRLNEGLENRRSILLDDYRDALRRSTAEERAYRQQEAEGFRRFRREQVIGQQRRGQLEKFSGIAQREKIEAVTDRRAKMDAYNRALQQQKEEREKGFTRAYETGRTGQERALADLTQSFTRGTEALEQGRRTGVASEYDRLQAEARKKAFGRYIQRYPGASQTYQTP